MTRKAKPSFEFLGHPLSYGQHKALCRLVNGLHRPLGSSMKSIKTEADLWTPLNVIFGFTPKKRDPFHKSVLEAFRLIEMFNREERMEMAKKVGYEPVDRSRIARAESVAMRRQMAAAKPPRKPTLKPNRSAKADFYGSWEWRALRMDILKLQGRTCQCCGARAGDMSVSGEPVRIVVDHIKPISKYWALRLDPANLQVLCDECNQGKGNWDETDWRADNVVPFPKRETA